jgi:hypothetical protein
VIAIQASAVDAFHGHGLVTLVKKPPPETGTF